jgi:hypothetical protein
MHAGCGSIETGVDCGGIETDADCGGRIRNQRGGECCAGVITCGSSG